MEMEEKNLQRMSGREHKAPPAPSLQTREETRRSVASVRSDPDFLDASAIERLAREIDQLSSHATMVSRVAEAADEAPPPPYAACAAAVADMGKEQQQQQQRRQEEEEKEEEEDLSAFTCPVCLVLPREQVLCCLET